MKRIIASFLAVMVICSFISVNAFASSDMPVTITGALIYENSQSEYSNEELNQIADEILEFADNINDIRCIKVSEEHKCIVIYISDSFEPDKLKEFAQLLENKYPNAAFVFSGGDPDDEFTNDETFGYGVNSIEKTGIGENGVLIVAVCAFLVLFAFLFSILILQRKKRLAYQTADVCDSACMSRNISRGSVLAEIKQNEYIPDKNTFSSIMDCIDKHT